MKRFPLSPLTLLIITASSQAEDGWHGNVSLHLGANAEQSNMNTNASAWQSSLDQQGQRNTEFVAIPMWNIHYRHQQHEAYYKTDLIGMASEFYTQLGYRYWLSEESSLALGYVPGLLPKETWADPYALNTNRQKIDYSLTGWVLNYDGLLGSKFNLELAFGEQKIDDEQSGQQAGATLTALSREGQLYYVQLGRQHGLSENADLTWQLHYLKADLDGDAMARQGYGIETELTLHRNRHITMLAINLTQRDFDKPHPLFANTRDEMRYGLAATYVYAGPFNWPNAAFVARAGWDQINSNVRFFDQQQTLLTLGLNYQF